MSAQRTIGVDVGGTKIVVGLVERDGTIVRLERRPTPVGSTAAFLAGLAEAVDGLRDESVGAVGIGIPSAIDQRSGTAVFSANIPLAGLDMRSWAAETFGLPAAIDNDANCAALAEWRAGAGRGTTDMVMITLRTGIGGGFGEAFDLLIDPVLEVVARDALSPARDVVRILPAELGPDAGVIGAALVGFEALDAAGAPAAGR